MLLGPTGLATGCGETSPSDDDGAATEGGIATTRSDTTTTETGGSETADGETSDTPPPPMTDDGDATSTGAADETGTTPTACEAPELPATSFATDIYDGILADNCSCHIVGAPNGLAMPDAATALPALLDGMTDSALVLVTPTDRDASYLWAKINGTADTVRGGSGGRMPLGGVLDCAQIEAIGAWIDAGAQP